jgi:hypothetical protein
VHNALALQMPRQSLPAAARLVLSGRSGANSHEINFLLSSRPS